MPAGKIHIGTSGWSYKDWKDLYYPGPLAAKHWLKFYAREFKCVEVNSSFYRLPTRETVVNWTEQVNRKFKFCPKLSRYLTHMKKLNDPEEPLERFFGIFDQVKKYLGPVLLQLPSSLHFNNEKIKHLFELLKNKYADYDFSIEARHKSWLQPEAVGLLKTYDIGWVISQSGVGFPYKELITAKHIYVRFHGPKELYASKYTAGQMKSYAAKFKNWLNDGYEVWVFFNNDWFANAIVNARMLQHYIAG